MVRARHRRQLRRAALCAGPGATEGLYAREFLIFSHFSFLAKAELTNEPLLSPFLELLLGLWREGLLDLSEETFSGLEKAVVLAVEMVLPELDSFMFRPRFPFFLRGILAMNFELQSFWDEAVTETVSEEEAM